MAEQSKANNISPGDTFNEVAGKIVSCKELRQRTKAIYKTELSFGEKLFLNLVDKPGSFIVGGVLAVTDAVTHKKRPGIYADLQSFPPKMYVSGAFMASMLKDASRLSFAPKRDAKLIGLTRKAFDACDDIGTTPKVDSLKPV